MVSYNIVDHECDLKIVAAISKGDKTMYARIATGQTQSDKSNEFLNTFQEVVLPDLKQEPGFKGLYLLKDPQSNKFVAIALYETEADARASETGYARRRLPQVAPLLAGQPVTETYEIVLRA
jgi:quinol monooxygenase YgiN